MMTEEQSLIADTKEFIANIERDMAKGWTADAFPLKLARLALASLETPVVPEAPLPKNLDQALTIMGVGLPESREELNLHTERWVQRLIDRVIRFSAEIQAHPVNQGGPVVTAPEFKVHSNQPCWPSLTVGLRDSEWVAALKKAGIRVKN